jgi:putative phosphoribosyl transferase
MVFKDRKHAGELLAPKLERFREARPIVLGLTRGGVPVAFEVARALSAPFDVMVVRKIGAPGCPEYALGAIAEGGAVYLNPEALLELEQQGAESLSALAEAEAVELARRVRVYRGDRPLPLLAGRTVIVVDDGVATGATARAAARAARDRGAARVVLAAPVIAAQSAPALKEDFDEIVAVQLPPQFFAVGSWYERFGQVTDEEVLEHLRRARAAAPAEGEVDGLWDGEWIAPAPADPPVEEVTLAIPFDDPRHGRGALDAALAIPDEPRGLVMFVHGSGSTRRSPRNRFVAETLQRAGIATLLFDLLTPAEAAEDELTGQLRFDIDLLTSRVVAATSWTGTLPRTRELRLAYFGASTGAAAALAAAAALPDRVAAVVSRGGRPDLVAGAVLEQVRAPVLLVVGRKDAEVLALNRAAAAHLQRAQLAGVPNAGHLFEEPGALEAVARLAATWLRRTLEEGDSSLVVPG